ncbi:hypothetical protein Agub_g14232 [Astrephomene gubernaculifera]|uniref:J domain-containing protein n=1 Tax=Astrephomene gubernaculifera TaxID=47775 RepID=A0AAD3E151_9CHLO|nr:hypothetical protein Agub_g14232 [Astrephomene gubernaculifera]
MFSDGSAEAWDLIWAIPADGVVEHANPIVFDAGVAWQTAEASTLDAHRQGHGRESTDKALPALSAKAGAAAFDLQLGSLGAEYKAAVSGAISTGGCPFARPCAHDSAKASSAVASDEEPTCSNSQPCAPAIAGMLASSASLTERLQAATMGAASHHAPIYEGVRDAAAPFISAVSSCCRDAALLPASHTDTCQEHISVNNDGNSADNGCNNSDGGNFASGSKSALVPSGAVDSAAHLPTAAEPAPASRDHAVAPAAAETRWNAEALRRMCRSRDPRVVRPPQPQLQPPQLQPQLQAPGHQGHAAGDAMQTQPPLPLEQQQLPASDKTDVGSLAAAAATAAEQPPPPPPAAAVAAAAVRRLGSTTATRLLARLRQPSSTARPTSIAATNANDGMGTAAAANGARGKGLGVRARRSKRSGRSTKTTVKARGADGGGGAHMTMTDDVAAADGGEGQEVPPPPQRRRRRQQRQTTRKKKGGADSADAPPAVPPLQRGRFDFRSSRRRQRQGAGQDAAGAAAAAAEVALRRKRPGTGGGAAGSAGGGDMPSGGSCCCSGGGAGAGGAVDAMLDDEGRQVPHGQSCHAPKDRPSPNHNGPNIASGVSSSDEDAATAPIRSSPSSSSSSSIPQPTNDPATPALPPSLEQHLHDWRAARARSLRKAPDVFLRRGLLMELVEACPTSILLLEEVPGLQRTWIRLYGQEVMDVCRNYVHVRAAAEAAEMAAEAAADEEEAPEAAGLGEDGSGGAAEAEEAAVGDCGIAKEEEAMGEDSVSAEEEGEEEEESGPKRQRRQHGQVMEKQEEPRGGADVPACMQPPPPSHPKAAAAAAIRLPPPPAATRIASEANPATATADVSTEAPPPMNQAATAKTAKRKRDAAVVVAADGGSSLPQPDLPAAAAAVGSGAAAATAASEPVAVPAGWIPPPEGACRVRRGSQLAYAHTPAVRLLRIGGLLGLLAEAGRAAEPFLAHMNVGSAVAAAAAAAATAVTGGGNSKPLEAPVALTAEGGVIGPAGSASASGGFVLRAATAAESDAVAAAAEAEAAKGAAVLPVAAITAAAAIQSLGRYGGRDHMRRLRTMVTAALPAWEVRRVLACRELSPEEQAGAVLRVDPRVGREEIRLAFRRLSLLVHPDKNRSRDASEAFSMVSAAARALLASGN